MARERITFPVNLRQNTNDDSTAFGKWFPVPSTSEPMSLKGFAKHLAEHGKLASYDMLVLVLQNIVSCLKELILQGQSVKLDGLGTFRPTVEGKKKVYFEKIAVSDYALSQTETTPGGEG